MPLLFNSLCKPTTFYRNPVSAGDLHSAILVESREVIELDHAGMTFQNWYFDGFRLAHSTLHQKQQTAYGIKNDIDAVKIYFNRKGRTHIHYNQLSKNFLLHGGQYNMLYSTELDSRMSHIDNHSEMFSLQIAREPFLELAGEGGMAMDKFTGKTAGRQSALFSNEWLSMDQAMEKCIGEILHCPFDRDLKKLYLHAKAVELFVYFAQGSTERSPAGIMKISRSDREKLYFVRDYLMQNFARPNTLTSLSKIAGLNEFKLKKGFSTLFNTSVMDFLISYRLEKARELLRNTEKNVSEIAYETGYASPAYFGKAFKKKYGVSPGKL